MIPSSKFGPNGTGAGDSQISLASVVKASQALSSELELPKLISRLMTIAIETTGADRGLLLVRAGDEYLGQAEARVIDDQVEVALRQDSITAIAYPESLIRHVIRTRERVILDDASEPNPFSGDEYLRNRQSKSVLCLPLMKQGKLTGILLLENTLTSHAFTPDRIAVLELLAVQAAISLENASLYSDLRLQAGLLQRLPVSAWTLKPDGTPDFVNEVWLETTGQALDFVRSYPEAWMTAVHPEDREAVAREFWRGVSTGTDFTMENRTLRARDGVYRWHLNQAVVLRDAEGKVLKFVGTTTDIDDQKRAEEELRASELRLREMAADLDRRVEQRTKELAEANEELRLQAGLLQNLPVSAWTLKPDGTPDFVNRVWLEIAGQTLDFVRSHPEAWMSAVHPDDREAVAQEFWRGVSTGTDFAMENRTLRSQDKVYRWHLNQAVVLRDAEGKVLKFVGTTTDIEDQKRAEEGVRANELRLREMAADLDRRVEQRTKELAEANEELQLQVELLQRIPVSAWTLTPDGTSDFVNQVWLEFSGQTLDFVRSHPEAWMTAVHPDDREAVSKAFWDGVRLGQGFTVEARSLRAQDGAYRWHLIQSVVLHDAEGKVLKFVGTATDIDDQKRAQEELRASEISLRQTLDTIPGLVSKANSDGMIELANRQLLTYFGKTNEEMNSWSTGNVVHPDDLPRVTAEITHSFKTGTPFDSELRYRRADGVHCWFHARSLPFRGADGEVTGWYFLLTDIEDRKRAEEKLRESEYESRLIVDSIPGLIAVLDTSGEIERVSQPILDYFGRSLEECRQWAVDDTIHSDDRPEYLQAFERSFASGDPFEYEAVRVRRFDGVYRWFNMRGLPLRDRQGQIVRWYFLLTEVDDRKRAEEALRQAQGDLARINRVTTMGELMASLAHELSQPISGAITNANICLRKLGHDKPDLDEVRAAVTRLGRDAKRAAEIITRVRSQFEKGSPKPQTLDVNEIIPETVALLRDEAVRYGIAVRTELADDLPQIVGDRVQLQQVAMNLIVNSIEAMKEADGIREIVIQSQRAENERILVSFTDTGIGLPPQLVEQVFEPFFTTKTHGTGMGLRISRSIIESHGGRLWAESIADRGAAFHLSLPAPVPAG